MTFYGMDPDLAEQQVNQLAHSGIDIIANAINAGNQVIAEIANNWVGPDATHFHNEWQGQHIAQLNNVKNELEMFRQRFQQNINEQRHASA